MTATEFETLSYAQQLQSIRPHLQLIIAEKYPPAQESIDKTYNKGFPPAAVRGDIPDIVIEDVFMPELRRWALRQERWGELEKGEEQERPVGSERYEELTPEERGSVSVYTFTCAVRALIPSSPPLPLLPLPQLIIRLLPAEAVRQIFIKINEYENLSSNELLDLIGEFGNPEVLGVDYSSYSQPQLMRLLTDLNLNEQAGIRDNQTQEVIKHLREHRNAMRKQLGLPVPENDVKDIITDARGRPIRQTTGRL